MDAINIIRRLHQRNDLFMEDVECNSRLVLPPIYKGAGNYKCFDTRKFSWAVFIPEKKLTMMDICNIHRWFEMHKIAMVFDATSMEHDVLPHQWKLMSMKGFDYVKSGTEICCIQLASKINATL